MKRGFLAHPQPQLKVSYLFDFVKILAPYYIHVSETFCRTNWPQILYDILDISYFTFEKKMVVYTKRKGMSCSLD